MSTPAMLTAREAYDLIHDSEPLPGGTYAFCYDVLDLWGAKPVNKESETNLVFMLSSVFAAGMEYATGKGVLLMLIGTYEARPSTATISAAKNTMCGAGAIL